jgi:hypothetical protein
MPRSMVEIQFRTPLTILLLMVGGGSGMLVKHHAQIYGLATGAPMDD